MSGMTRALTGVALVVWLLATGSAGAGAATATRTVKVKMVDVAYEPSTLEAFVGETVRFSFVNRGKVVHDAFIGTRREQRLHEREMRADDDSGHGHGTSSASSEVGGLTVKPGRRGTLSYTFDQAGEIEIGCHEPGHYKDGMVIKVAVTDPPPS